jgi:hypothetical protein
MEKKKEFYILDKGGQMVYYLDTSKGLDDDEEDSKLLTASYLTGILQFAKAASGDIISNFELGKMDIYLKVGKELPLYYVYIVGKKIRSRKRRIDKYLSKIIDEFEKQYSEKELDEWDGDLSAFNEFTPTVKKILKI